MLLVGQWRHVMGSRASLFPISSEVLLRRIRNTWPVTLNLNPVALDAFIMLCVDHGSGGLGVIAINNLVAMQCAQFGWQVGQELLVAFGG